MKVSRNNRRKMMAAGLAGLVITAGTAFAATNTVPNRNAGAGTGEVSGFTVNSIGYLPAANPLLIGQVTFDISRDSSTTVVDSSNATVLVSIDDGDTYYPCSVSLGLASCNITDSVTFGSVVTADIVAYDVQNSPG